MPITLAKRYFIGVIGLTCLIKLVRFLSLISAVLYHFSCIDVSFYFLVHCIYSRLSKWRPSAILNFNIFANFVKNSNYCLFLHRCAKFGEDWMIQGRVTAYFRFSKWRPSAILVFHNFAIFVTNSNLCLFLRRFVNFLGWTIPGRVIAYFLIFKMTAICHLGFGMTS